MTDKTPSCNYNSKNGIFALADTSNSFPAVVYMLIAQVLVNPKYLSRLSVCTQSLC